MMCVDSQQHKSSEVEINLKEGGDNASVRRQEKEASSEVSGKVSERQVDSIPSPGVAIRVRAKYDSEGSLEEGECDAAVFQFRIVHVSVWLSVVSAAFSHLISIENSNDCRCFFCQSWIRG